VTGSAAMSRYEEERDRQIAKNKLRLQQLGVLAAADVLRTEVQPVLPLVRCAVSIAASPALCPIQTLRSTSGGRHGPPQDRENARRLLSDQGLLCASPGDSPDRLARQRLHSMRMMPETVTETRMATGRPDASPQRGSSEVPLSAAISRPSDSSTSTGADTLPLHAVSCAAKVLCACLSQLNVQAQLCDTSWCETGHCMLFRLHTMTDAALRRRIRAIKRTDKMEDFILVRAGWLDFGGTICSDRP